MSNLETLYNDKSKVYYSQDRLDMLEFLPPKINSLLDVGCSNGEFGKLVKERFKIRVWGVEPNQTSANEASAKLDTVYPAYFDVNLHFGQQKFDCITFNDVLEHLSDPWAALQRCQSLLTSDGVIVASIPNVQCYSVIRSLIVEQDWKYKPSGILDKTHLRFFTKKSIIRLFDESGFKVDKIKGMNSIKDKSSFLKLISTVAKNRTENFMFTNFAIVASPKSI